MNTNKTNIERKYKEMISEAKRLGVIPLTKKEIFIDDDHLNCVWYGGYIGGIKYKGYELSIEVNGDVEICGIVNGKDFEYVNRLDIGAMSPNASDHLRTTFASDAAFNEALQYGEIEYGSNNWIETYVSSPSGNWDEGMIADDSDDVLDVCCNISSLVDYLEENFIKTRKP